MVLKRKYTLEHFKNTFSENFMQTLLFIFKGEGERDGLKHEVCLCKTSKCLYESATHEITGGGGGGGVVTSMRNPTFPPSSSWLSDAIDFSMRQAHVRQRTKLSPRVSWRRSERERERRGRNAAFTHIHVHTRRICESNTEETNTEVGGVNRKEGKVF